MAYEKPKRSESQSLDDGRPIDVASLLPSDPPGADASRRAEERVVRSNYKQPEANSDGCKQQLARHLSAPTVMLPRNPRAADASCRAEERVVSFAWLLPPCSRLHAHLGQRPARRRLSRRAEERVGSFARHDTCYFQVTHCFDCLPC